MKIGFIVSMKYGLTQFIYRDIEALAGKGHQVTLLTLRQAKGLYNPLPAWPVIAPSKWRLLLGQLGELTRRPKKYLQLLLEAWKTGSVVDFVIAVAFARKMRGLDVMYAYFGDHKLFVGYYCKKLTGVPLVVSIRAYELYRNPNPQMFRRTLPYCDRVVTITDYNKETLVRDFGLTPGRIDVIRQIVDLDSYKYRPTIKILIVGFFAEKKGHDVLFRAFKQLQREDVELWVVGDMNPSVVRVDCRKLAKELGIDSKVAFFGAQRGAALKALYRECDIFCLPSRPDRHGDKEGFPNVIAEAMAFGKPVVSTRHAGIPEAVDSILVEENDVEGLTSALHQVCDSEDLQRRMGDRNRRAAECLFAVSNNDQLERVLERHSKTTAQSSTPVDERLVPKPMLGAEHTNL